MNNRRSRFLLSFLVAVVVLGLVLVPAPSVFGLDASLATTRPPAGQQPPAYKLGEAVELDGEVSLVEGEVRNVVRVTLNILGPQPLEVNLPLIPGQNQDLTSLLPLDDQNNPIGQLLVDVVLDNIIVDGFGYGYGYGYYQGGPGGGRFRYHIKWVPPIFKYPPPIFTQVPAYDPAFPVPQLQAPPPPDSGSVLPNTSTKFSIPTVGAVQGTPLPQADPPFDIPQVTVTSSVPDTVPNLPDSTSAFDVPTVTVTGNPTGVGDGLPETVAAFDIPTVSGTELPAGVPQLPDTIAGFDIPLWPAPTAPDNEPTLSASADPNSASAFTTPGGATPKGITWDGTNFWMLVGGTPDRIIKVDTSGQPVGSAILGPGASRAPSGLRDLVYLNGSLWVLGNSQNTDMWWGINLVYKLTNPSTDTENTPDWANLTQFSASEMWSEMGGITAQGSGASGTLWLVRKDGGRLFQVDQSGDELGTAWSDTTSSKNGVAFYNGSLYTSSGNKISQWSTNGTKVKDVTTNPARSGIQGMTFKGSVLYFISNDKDVYKSFIAETPTTYPKGVAIQTSGSDKFLWVLVDGDPKDKLLKVNASTGALAAFGKDGAVDVPSKDTEGITLLGTALWIVANEGGTRKLYKVSTSTGAVQTEFDLGTVQVWGDIGDLTSDGTKLHLYEKSNNWLHIISYDSGTNTITREESKGTCCPQGLTITGARGVAYHSGREQYFVASGTTLATFDSSWGFVSEQGLTDDQTSVTGVEGVTFDGDLLYVVRKAGDAGKVTRGGLATNVTTSPRGIALSTAAATAGRALWILVDGDPKDKVLKVNADTGDLLTSFDAPTDRAEGIAFLRVSNADALWIVANEVSGRKVYKVNPSTGKTQSTFDIGSFVWWDLGDLTTDGTNLIALGSSENHAVIIDTTGQKVEDKWTCCPSVTGARGLTYNTQRQQYFTASGGKLVVWDSTFSNLVGTEPNLTVGGDSLSGVQGLVFEDNVLYVARKGTTDTVGKVTKGGLFTTVTTDPRGIAVTPTTAAGGRALWILVDGNPKDKLLKVDPDTGVLDSVFGGGTGAVDAPSDKTEGIAYLKVGATDYLWIASNETSGRKLYKVKPTDGSVSGDPIDLGQMQFWWDIGDLTSDGTNLVLYTQSENRAVVITTAGEKVSEKWPFFQNFTGARGLAYHTGRGQYYIGSGGKLGVLDTEFNSLREQQLTLDGADVTGLQGLAFEGDALYTARAVIGGAGKIARGALRTTVTTNPRGIAYSPATATSVHALWVLVDGDPRDKVLKVDPDTQQLVTSFDAPNDKTEGITFLSNFLWIAANEGNARKLYKVNPTTGAIASSEDLSRWPGGWLNEDIGDLTNDGANLIAYAKQNNDRAWVINTSFEKVEEWNIPLPWDQSLGGAGGVAYRSAKDQLFAAKGGKVLQLARGGGSFVLLEGFNTTLTSIQGMVFVGETVYIAHIVGSSGKVSTAVAPSEISNKPVGLAYDASANELYILVDGKVKDHIIVVDATTGAVLRNFAAPHRDTGGVAYIANNLYVSVNQQEPCCNQSIRKLNPQDGTEIAGWGFGSEGGWAVTGLDTDGTNLLVGMEGSNYVAFLDPAEGQQVSRQYFFDFQVDQWQSLAYLASAKHFFLTQGKTVIRVDGNGMKVQDWLISTTGVNNVMGAAFVGDALYLAEAGGSTIQSAGIPAPPVEVSNTPKAMASDGTNLYVAVEASPWDKVLKLSLTGQLLGSFNAPGDETVGLAWHNGFLYALSHDPAPPVPGEPPRVQPRLHKIDATTGEEIGKPWGIRMPFGPGELYERATGGLASDGAFLYVALVDGNFLKVNPNDPQAPSQRLDQFNGMLPRANELHSVEVVLGRLVASGSSFGGPANVLARFNKDNGVMVDQFPLGNGVDITGTAYVGITFYMADGLGNRVIKTIMPDNTPESTIVGDNYQGKLVAEYNSFVESPLAPFRIIKNPEVKVQITEPQPDFSTSAEQVNVGGYVNDPALTRSPFNTVTVDVELPSTTLFEDTVAFPGSNQLWTPSGTPSPLWYISCQSDPNGGKVKSPQCAWRYGRPNGPDFNTLGTRNVGDLTAQGIFNVGPGTGLAFATWYDTEPPPDRDKKTVEVAEVTRDLQGNDVVGEFKPVAQILGRGFGGGAPPPNAAPGFRYIEVDPAKFIPGQQGPVASFFDVFVDLGQFQGKRIKVRFHFDSVDGFGNSGNGWYLDDIRISGAGVKRTVATVTPLAQPQTINGDTYFGRFDASVTLDNGPVTLKVKAVQPYAPFLQGEASVSGFQDRQPPQLNLFGIPGETNSLLHTLRGTVFDMTFQSVEIRQQDVFGDRVIYALSSLPQDGEFSVPVSLVEGENIFTAVATDGSGLTTSVELRTKADVTKPTVTNVRVIIPVGETKARPGDQIVMDISVNDGTGSGVGQVLMFMPGDNQGIPLISAAELPGVVRNLWQVTGDFVGFGTVPASTPPGVWGFTVKAVDQAGNTGDPVAGQITVVSTLEKFNRYLMPGFNFISTPLQCTGAKVTQGGVCSNDGTPTFDIAALLEQEVPNANPNFDPDGDPNTPVRLKDVIETISTFSGGTAATGEFLVYTTDPAADTLTKLEVLTGYLVKTKAEAFKVSPGDVWYPFETKAPIKLTFSGSILLPGDVPPVRAVVGGWNTVAAHTENASRVERFLAGVSVPAKKWASLLSYVNAVTFMPPTDSQAEGELKVFLGAFKGKFEGDTVAPGDGFWLYMVEAGNLVSVLE